MSRLKQSLPEDFSVLPPDSMSQADWDEAMQGMAVWSAANTLTEAGYTVIPPQHDCDLINGGGEDSCNHPSHGEDIV